MSAQNANAVAITGGSASGLTGVSGSGDLNMGGGYRVLLEGWYADNPIGVGMSELSRFGAGAAFPSKALMPRAGSVTALGVKSNAARVGGTLTARLYKNGGLVAGLTAVLDGTNTTWHVSTAAKDTYAFAAGDELSIMVDCSPDWDPTTADIRVVLEVEI
jgi:hypothetical protein